MFDIFKKLDWFFKAQWKRYAVAIVLLAINACGDFAATVFSVCNGCIKAWSDDIYYSVSTFYY